ncbi:hypothetical protein GF352_02090 [archaeon]|nr:hypothetical protein [archaeon]
MKDDSDESKEVYCSCETHSLDDLGIEQRYIVASELNAKLQGLSYNIHIILFCPEFINLSIEKLNPLTSPYNIALNNKIIDKEDFEIIQNGYNIMNNLSDNLFEVDEEYFNKAEEVKNQIIELKSGLDNLIKNKKYFNKQTQ